MRVVYIYTTVVSTLLFFTQNSLFGQLIIEEGIDGPTNVTVGDQVTYTWGQTMNVRWEIIGGVLEHNSTNNYAYVTWTQAGQGVVRKKSIFTGTVVESLNVSVAGEVAPNVPPQPSISTNLCGNKTLSRSGNPPAGVRWYWQTSSTGQSTNLGYNATRSVSQSGTYYLRARNINGQQLWSSSASSGVVANVYVADRPPSPTVNYITDSPDILFCESRAVIVMPSSPSNQTYYWQGQNRNGTFTSNSGQNYEVTSSGTYYLRSKYNSVNCWSTSRAIEIVLNGPPQPSAPSIINETCEAITLQRPADPPGDLIRHYWQGTNQGDFSKLNSSSTYIVSETGRYYLRSYNSGTLCWGLSSYIDVEIDQPAVPPMPSISRVCGLTEVTMPLAPSGQTFYWQFNESDEFTDLINSSNTLDFNQNQMLYLKSRSDDLCWSEARTINITVKQIAEVPSPEISYNCSHVHVIYLRITEDTNKYRLVDGQGNEVIPELEGPYGPSSWHLNSNGTYFFEIDQFAEGSNDLCKGEPQEIMVEDLLIFPQVNAGPDESAFAFGTPFNLQGHTPLGGEWTGAGTGSGDQFDPGSLAPGNYTVTYHFINPNGCSVSKNKTITLVAGPVLQASTENILPGNKSILTVASEYNGYTWYKDGVILTGEHTNEITVDKPGQYYVKVEAGRQSVNSHVVTISDSRLNKQHNFIREYTIKSEGVVSSQDLLDFEQTNMVTSTQYIDGLGNVMQVVAASNSPTYGDFVQTFQYVYGMELKSYLPYTHSNADGLVKNNALNDEFSYETSDQYQFYSNSNTRVARTNFPYGERIIEPWASYRVQKQSHPGEAWQRSESDTADDNTIEFNYTSNGENEVFLFSVSNGQNLVLKGYHAPGSLFETQTTDENNSLVIELTDHLDRTVQKKVQANEAATEWADTYYIYDDFGNLRYVLPPEAVKTIGSPSTFPYAPSSMLLATWAFQYQYDGRRRMIEKKVPGAEPVKMIYDNRDRLVLTQDGNQRNENKWLFTKYDALNRPIITGEKVLTASESTLRDLLDGPDWLQNYAAYETLDGDKFGYTSNSLPKNITTDEILTVTYYDDYTFPHASAYPFVPELGNTAAFDRVKGQITGAKVKILDGSNTWLDGITYYDNRYRVIQSQTETLLDGVDRVTNRYDFIGQVIETKTTHSDKVVLRTYDYDHAGRLINTWHQVNDQDQVLLASNVYNELGQLIEKNLHQEQSAQGFVQSVDYRYNIRGWLTSINNAQLATTPENNDTDQATDYCGMELVY